MFTFPVLTYSLLYQNGKFVDEEFARWCSDHNTVWNDSNFFVSENVGTLSNCCRLLSDTKKLNAFINSIGGTALSIGSIKVNTINLMRIALETSCDEKEYLKMLKHRTELCCKTLDVIRHIITRNIEKGLLPNYQPGAIEMDKQYSTIGILGLFEVMERYIDNNITQSLVFGGLEPFDSFDEMVCLIERVREKTQDDIVIYTGYNEDEVADKLDVLRKYKNIIVKFGRYRPNDTKKYDEVLGINLASSNQYAKKIS